MFFRVKPRVAAIPGRKTYTEDELQSALQDILSGKLGTRRAAVQYGIPRSTLRNKVYKLSEPKREASHLPQAGILDAVDADDDDKELSGAEDDKDSDIVRLSADDQLGLSRAAAAAQLQRFQQSLEGGGGKPSADKANASMSASAAAAQLAQSSPWLDPMMMQNIFLTGLMQHKSDDPAFQELLRNLLIQQEMVREQLKNSISHADHMNNGKSSAENQNLLHNLAAQQQQQNRLIKSETPDLMTPADPNDSEDAAVILKIPSFKPVAGSSSSSGKNGEHANDSTPQTTPPLLSRSPHTHLGAGISPPILRPSNDSQSPPMGGLLGSKAPLFARDVIASSLSRTYGQQAQQKQPQGADALTKASMEQLEQYKRPSISVIKNLGGTDFTRFATSPNMMSQMHSNNSNSPSNMNNNSGKGTRPKRGKYRNYDRDSLVEAVKAVQRGEMSVHRAGSYYGVPHSTLEYKVKERHLMRPRKREPKPQPLDGGGASVAGSLKTHGDIGAATSLRTMDKAAKGLSTAKSPLKTPPFPASSPNGMKMGMFDPSQMQYQPLFWSHHPSGYSGLPALDFAQRPAAGSASFPSNTEAYFASQMIQRMQEDNFRQSNAASSAASKGVASTSVDIATAAAAAALSKSKLGAHDAKESTLQSLYEGAGPNGTLLDEIIRQSLDRKNEGAILSQLNKNRYGLAGDGEANHSNKRSGSPFSYTSHAIKRERTSSSSGETDRESSERDIPKESVEALLKYRERLANDLPEESNGVSADHKASHNNEHDDSS